MQVLSIVRIIAYRNSYVKNISMNEEDNKAPQQEPGFTPEPEPEPEPKHEPSFGDKLREFVRPLYVKIILSFIGIFLLLWAFVSTCSSPPAILQKNYTIALDPSWYPLQTQIKQRNMTAFCESLLKEIIKGTKIQINITQVPSDRLFSGLNADKYDGVISLLLPIPSITEGYSYFFSSPIYRIGPVLVVNTSDPALLLEQMNGKLVALVGEARMSTDIDHYPTVIFTGYDDIAQAFADLNNRKIDGLITDSSQAKNFISGLYQFKVADFLDDNEGIRLILRENKGNEFFLHFFNKKLEELRADGTYSNLLEMWKIPPE